MYNKLPNLVIGFHGCDRSVYEKVLYGHEPISFSNNLYDWLGNGMYFWEHNFDRALEWAIESSKRPESKITQPSVIGAVIDLGLCLNLLDSGDIKTLKNQYEILKKESEDNNFELPQNKNIKGNSDLLLRFLDCAVIEHLHFTNKILGEQPYDSVRGVFTEGDAIYETSGFKEKTHIQLCIKNPNCIKGYFAPNILDDNYPLP